MSDPSAPKKKPKKRYLLTAVALSTGSMMAGCGSQQGDGDPGQGPQGEVREVEPFPMPANPKGSVYDDGLSPNGEQPVDPEPDQVEQDQIDPVEPEEVEPTTEPLAEPPPEQRPHKVLPLPANPKGALYDHGPYRASEEDDEA
jgi:hypothetical protein